MLFFGHIGNTVGLAMLGRRAAGSPGTPADEPGTGPEHHPGSESRLPGRIRRAAFSLDYRLVIVGSMLPDMIDKPAWLLAGDVLNWPGRGYAHTLLFNLALVLGGVVMARRQNRYWLLTLSVSSLVHLVFDAIWQVPATMWWPLLGPIRPRDVEGWFSGLWAGLLHNPFVYVSEALGLAVTGLVGFRVLAERRLGHFLRTGDIDGRRDRRTPPGADFTSNGNSRPA